MIRESLELSIDSLKHRKISSALTMLGIVIGITSIISLLSIAEGLQQSVTDQLEAIGSDKIIVSSAGDFFSSFIGEGLKEDDIDMVEDVNGVEVAFGILFKTVSVRYRKENMISQVIGVRSRDTDKIFEEMNVWEIDSGRYFKSGEKGVAVVGKLAAEDVFEKEITIGDFVYVKEEKFKVLGILKSTANNQRDKSIFIPMDQLRELTDTKDSITMIFVKISDLTKAEEIAEEIEEELEDLYGEGYYQASTSDQIAESVGSIIAVLSFVLGGIASIALIVAGVGIANTMFTSVMERTKEIGVMKAIGATNYNVMEIFLVESGMLGFFGGLIGTILGFIISQVITLFAGSVLPVPFRAVVSPEMVIFSLMFSFFVGIISGIWPARRAAKLQPVEALRR
ncbi:MAG: ABC transporter permease [Candidatus Aenigmatarchaeota archaeon]